MSLKCHLRQIPKNSINNIPNAPKRSGRYLKSMYGIDGFGHTRWVVGCYIDLDYSNYIKDMGEKAFIEGCVSYLNQPPTRQKFQRTQREPPYGKLELYSYRLRETNGERFVELELITDVRKNKNFWGEGTKLDTGRKNRSSKTRGISQRQQY
jgi:hypothetical protein